jgi:hypothetical protein
VVLNDDRLEPSGASQFQPPSDSCSASSRSTRPRVASRTTTSWPKYAPAVATCPLMHGSSSPAKKGFPSHSGGPEPCHVTWSRTRPTAPRASALAGSSPRWRSSHRTCIVEFHPRFHAASPHRPSAPCMASSRAPQPWVATLARSAATSCAGAPVRSRFTCQRIEGSESSSQPMTDLIGCCLTGWVPNLFSVFVIVENSARAAHKHLFLLWVDSWCIQKSGAGILSPFHMAPVDIAPKSQIQNQKSKIINPKSPIPKSFTGGLTRRPAGTSQTPGKSNSAAIDRCRYACRREPTGG